ncbi:MAG: glycosyltransferase family 2 protein [Hyphomicrobiales bacterium]|nr:glycosyltransferase family 2 protein [Hyphomicrobiales bacterium]
MLQPVRMTDAPEKAGALELAVVAPTFNERENIPLLLERVAAALTGVSWELIVVDDDSPDGTADVVRQLSLKDPRIRVIHRIGRRGLSSAVVEGVLSTAAPFVAVMDADLQHDETLLPGMLKVLRANDADIVVGSRYMDQGGVGDWDESRQWKSRLATRLSRLVVKAELKDPMSGFFAFKREMFDASVRRLSAQGYKILLDVIASAPNPPRIRELPYVFRQRQHGESKLDMLVTLEYINLLLDKLFGRWVPVRFILFAAVGGLGVFVHMAVLSALVMSERATFINAQTVAALTAMTFNFFVNNVFTYRDRRLRGARQLAIGLLSFYLVCSFGMIANVGIANFLFENRYSWILSGVAGIIIGAAWNYVATSIFTWRAR